MTTTETRAPILDIIEARAKLVDEAKHNLSERVRECNEAVLEAVDNGEPYRDIADAAGRSVGWVQTALRALGVEGPRVRRRTPETVAKAKAARRKSKK